ncbi:malonyl-ACP O-methyltransferase BioC [Natronospira bacteriovora]|uniref:Malonyl-[acyl-carrier protein] O-methyltransferase n=1 Tax=Natronospira bacteriovora TaxID=3069753 RepID=A0ABU0W816_9GAMM|nr:malonyl-ACP O-methyltransferase BioC [Natronospira sp. AB-CW4]MDQ2070175.1 malonyl-ACP O-methyltransferase BioC [Natronospira sp. AB-CW4]
MTSPKRVDPNLPRLETGPETHPSLPERAAVRRSFDQAADSYDEHAVLQREVCNRLLERLDLTTIEPRVILDLAAGTGQASGALNRKYRKARVFPVDLSEQMLQRARRQGGWWKKLPAICADVTHLPIADDSVDLVFSSLGLQWVDDLDRCFREIRRVLKPQGLFLFTTFGPDTLKELRAAWQAVDERSHVNVFADMHDIGDGLVRAGLAEPVMEVEHFTLTYETADELMRDIKRIGAHNVTADRPRGLTGPKKMARFREAYEQFRQEDRLPATYEVVYGTVWAPRARNI